MASELLFDDDDDEEESDMIRRQKETLESHFKQQLEEAGVDSSSMYSRNTSINTVSLYCVNLTLLSFGSLTNLILSCNTLIQ